MGFSEEAANNTCKNILLATAEKCKLAPRILRILKIKNVQT